jgi:hypothetical protein
MNILKETRIENPDKAGEYILQRAFADRDGAIWFQFETNLAAAWLVALSRDRSNAVYQAALEVCLTMIARRYGWDGPDGIAHMKCMIDTNCDITSFDWKTSPGTCSSFFVCTSPDTFDEKMFANFCSRNAGAVLACYEASQMLNLCNKVLAKQPKKHPLQQLISAWPKDVDDIFLTQQEGVTPLVAHLRDRTDASIVVDLHALDDSFYEVRSPMFAARPRLNTTSPSAFLRHLSTLS